MRLQRETQALHPDKGPLSPGRVRAATASRLLRSGMAAAAAAAAAVASPMRRVQADMFSTATPQKPSQPVTARESGVEAASVVAAAGAQEQRDVAEGEQQSVYAREGDDREQQAVHAREGDDQAVNAVDAAVAQERMAVQDGTAQILQVLQQVRAEMAELRVEVAEVRAEVQQVRTEVLADVEQRVCPSHADRFMMPRARSAGTAWMTLIGANGRDSLPPPTPLGRRAAPRTAARVTL